MAQYKLEKDGSFVIEDYNRSKPWSSFFPGIAGLFGIPLWVFYVNRGQGIAGMGVRSKDEAIMEFLPANKAYQLVSSQGFRTFIKIKKSGKSVFYEPFSVGGAAREGSVNNRMIVRPHDLRLTEDNPKFGLNTEVSYFCICNEPFAGLVRELKLENTSSKPLDMELLDGLSILIPYGINNFFLKEMSRTIEAWMMVENLDSGVPLYKLSTDPRDSAQVAFVKGGNFYTAFAQGAKARRACVIVDPAVIFDSIYDFSFPVNFAQRPSFIVPKKQVTGNKTPCAFSFSKIKIPPKKSFTLFSVVGHVFDSGDIQRCGIDKMNEDVIARKRKENEVLINSIMDRIFTSSGQSAFDLYARQTFLDNCLRGGLPYSIRTDGHERSVYVFSRKHGDLERDYNRFFVSATYFSEGEGNYRDVNQNRRSDIFFNPLVADKNIVDFMNLIQLDGYNPLIYKGDRFTVPLEKFQNSDLAKVVSAQDAKKVGHLLGKPFVLGDVLRYIDENKIVLKCSLEEFVKMILRVGSSEVEAVFGEGYWTDHWTYNTDLLESFSALFPDRMKHLLWEKSDFTYFDTHIFVKPRAERYVVRDGLVKQYHAIGVDDAKNALIHKRHEEKNKVRIQNGEGAVYRTTLVEKLVCLILNKCATLDPCGAGIEMEADKPSWYDALNGLPGLCGSSLSETLELKRLARLLSKFIEQSGASADKEIPLACEIRDFLGSFGSLLRKNPAPFEFWDEANTLKEGYRLKVRRGLSGERKNVSFGDLKEFLRQVEVLLEAATARGSEGLKGIFYTYFSNEVVRYETQTDPSGRHIVVPKEFRQHRLPLFLEGFVHALRTEFGQARAIHEAVQKSPLWDKKLKMYKVNASLKNESFELGRTKAFTPGWLENESIWLHMEYKYLLELLKNQLTEIFYQDFFNVLIPFQEARRYGRSPLENSSFIASSVHPDPFVHGAGFVARLSGSTAEFLHMWLLMNVGPEPFFISPEGELNLRFRPALSRRLFSKKQIRQIYTAPSMEEKEVVFPVRSYSFLFLGKTLVTYVNPDEKDTFGKDRVEPLSMVLWSGKEQRAQVSGGVIMAPYAQDIREGRIDRIEILLGKNR